MDKIADVMAINIQNNGQQISDPEFISDADSNEVGFHNFKVGMDGVPRAHFFIIPYGTDSTTLYYTQRNNLVTLDEYLLEYQNLQMYPNPVSNQLIIKLENETIDYVTIFDSSGKIVNKIKKNEFSVSNLDEGIYFIEIEFANKKIRTKFLKN